MVKESEVSYGEVESYGKPNVSYQDVLWQGHVIGCLISSYKNMFSPMREVHQVCVPETPSNKAGVDWYESEDEGYIMAVFEDLAKFITYADNNIEYLTQ
tara:strand:+ start:492 stop:788 length:297 start_codon:yes stop_codon:yes gene_type:complete